MIDAVEGSGGSGVALDRVLEDLPADLPREAAPVVRFARSPSDLVRLLSFLLVGVVLSAGLAWATDAVLDVEEDLVGTFSFLDSALGRFLDGFASVLVVVVFLGGLGLAVALKRYRLLGYILVANTLAWSATTTALWAVGRDDSEVVVNRAAERAGIDLDDTLTATSLAQFVAMFIVLGPFVSARWRRAGLALTALLCLLRVLLALHLPSELLLSLTFGAAAGCAVLLAFGRPDQRPSTATVAAALGTAGLPVATLQPASVDARGSTPYLAELRDGTPIFAKVLSPKERSADLLFRAYRFLRLRSVGDERPFSSLRRSVEHEALVSLQARDVGVRTPRLRAIASVGPESIGLAYDRIDGGSMDRLDGDVPDALLVSLWQQVAVLRAHRIAHRDLRRANVFVDDEGAPWIIDFGFSEVAASEQLLDADIAQLLAATSLSVGAHRSVAAAVEVLGAEAVGGAARLLQPNALSGATKTALHEHGHLLDELRGEVIAQAGIEEPEYVRIERFNARTLLILAMLAGATYFLLPQLADLPGIVDQVQDANWWWVVPLVAASVVTYAGAAASLLGAIPQRLATLPTFVTQVASSFTSRLAPSSVGGMALNLRYLQKAGVDTAVGTSGIGLNVVVGALIHVALLVVFLVWTGRSAFDEIQLPDPAFLLYGLAAVVVVAGAAYAVPAFRRATTERLLPIARRSLHSVHQVLRSPAKLALLAGGSATVTLSYVAAIYVSTQAFGGGLSFAQVGAVYLLGAAVASAAPTPGGLGALEAAVIAGLVAAGMAKEVAVPAVFLYRIATFWLPILPGWLSFTWLERRQYV